MEAEVNEILKQLKHQPNRTEEQTDALMERLHQLAKDIQKLYERDPGSVSPHLKEVYHATTAKTLGPMIIYQSNPVLYEDSYDMFPRHTPSARLIAVTEPLVIQETHPPSTKDTNVVRMRFRDAIFRHGREGWFKDTTQTMCKTCQSYVPSEMFVSIMEMLTIDLKDRETQLMEWRQQKKISEIDYKHLLRCLQEAIAEADTLLDEVGPIQQATALHMEKAFRILIRLLNEMMFRYVQTEQIKQSVS
jgi:hypothetical protein